MRPTLLRRTWTRAALAPALAFALALALAPTLLDVGPGRPVVVTTGPRGDVARVAPVHSVTAPAPRLSAQVRPIPAPTPSLSPLALGWRAAVVDGPRAQVRPLMAALRRAPDGREQLERLARDPHERVRAFALRALGEVREPTLRDVFLAAREDPSPHVRDNAQWALAQLEVR
jgi:hypothetical protein